MKKLCFFVFLFVVVCPTIHASFFYNSFFNKEVKAQDNNALQAKIAVNQAIETIILEHFWLKDFHRVKIFEYGVWFTNNNEVYAQQYLYSNVKNKRNESLLPSHEKTVLQALCTLQNTLQHKDTTNRQEVTQIEQLSSNPIALSNKLWRIAVQIDAKYGRESNESMEKAKKKDKLAFYKLLINPENDLPTPILDELLQIKNHNKFQNQNKKSTSCD